MTQRARLIAEQDEFAKFLGTRVVHLDTDHIEVLLPYKPELGVGRVHGGAISGLIDIAATACFWAHPEIPDTARGATVGFTVNFLQLAVTTDIRAIASIRRRGGTLCTGDVSVRNADDQEIATAIVTYKLSR